MGHDSVGMISFDSNQHSLGHLTWFWPGVEGHMPAYRLHVDWSICRVFRNVLACTQAEQYHAHIRLIHQHFRIKFLIVELD
jgi:hypothetical protein